MKQQSILTKSREANIIGFFPFVESYLTATEILTTVSLEEQCTYFNKKYLRNHNFAHYLFEQGMRNDKFSKI